MERTSIMKSMKTKQITTILLLLLLLTGCALKNQTPLTLNGVYFDTVISVTIYDSKDESLLTDIKSLCEKYDTLLSRENPDSEITKINEGAGAPVTVSAETAALIKDSLAYSELSGGLFDISIGTVLDLWDFKSEAHIVPDEQQIKEALSHVGYKNIQVDGNTVILKDNHTEIDLGAIAKGYIADKIADYLKEQNVKSALINLGGNVLAIGEKPDGSKFNIGIQKPFDETGTPITSIHLKDSSSVTSGIYQRYFKEDDTIYHHIIDPTTGYPAKNSLLSVTIINSSSTKADALSTTCFLLGLDKGMQLINSLEDTKAIFITDDNKLHYSDNLN